MPRHLIVARFEEAFPYEMRKNWRVCLAVSGGADSVALARAAADVFERDGRKDALCIATVDHSLRGEESREDARFVIELARSLGIEGRLIRLDHGELAEARQRLGSLEDAAREARYRRLSKVAREIGARFLLTAHTLNDQLETILFRFFRGSGFEGIRGIPQIRPLDESLIILRPLLGVSRAEIVDYLTKLGQSHRTDSSNSSPEFDRNRIRSELVPLLDSIFPGKWQGALSRFATLCDETVGNLDKRADELEIAVDAERNKAAKFAAALSEFGALPQDVEPPASESVAIPLAPLLGADDQTLCQFIRRVWKGRGWSMGAMGAEEWRRLVEVVRGEKKQEQFPGNILADCSVNSELRLRRMQRRDG